MMGGNNRAPQQKVGTIKDNPDPSLQAKLRDNFDFSQRTLEESKEPKPAEGDL